MQGMWGPKQGTTRQVRHRVAERVACLGLLGADGAKDVIGSHDTWAGEYSLSRIEAMRRKRRSCGEVGGGEEEEEGS